MSNTQDDSATQIPKIEIVTWVDSRSDADEWVDAKDVKKLKLPVCHSVGFVLQVTEEIVVIASSMNANKFAGILTIPRRAILKHAPLEPPALPEGKPTAQAPEPAGLELVDPAPIEDTDSVDVEPPTNEQLEKDNG